MDDHTPYRYAVSIEYKDDWSEAVNVFVASLPSEVMLKDVQETDVETLEHHTRFHAGEARYAGELSSDDATEAMQNAHEKRVEEEIKSDSEETTSKFSHSATLTLTLLVDDMLSRDHLEERFEHAKADANRLFTAHIEDISFVGKDVGSL